MSELNWRMYPTTAAPPDHILELVGAFELVMNRIGTPAIQSKSNEVLSILRPGLESRGWLVESGKKAEEKISRPVLFGDRGVTIKSFEVDAYHADSQTVLEVEAGRAVTNHQFLKDLFEACMIQDCRWLAIAVQNAYKPPSASRPLRDFDSVVAFMETLYASRRLELPIEGLVVVGY